MIIKLTNDFKKYLRSIIFVCLLALLLVASMCVNVINKDEFFFNPDEVSNYVVTKQYVEDGTFYLTDENIEYDTDNNLHPRGFITLDEKIVTFNFLGLPIFYGSLATVVGTGVRTMSVILLLLLILYLKKVFDVIWGGHKDNYLFIMIALLGCSPVIHYFNYSYLNILGAGTFFVVSLFYLLSSTKDTYILTREYVLSIFFALIAIWFRYNYVLYIGVLFVVHIISNFKSYLKYKSKILTLAVLVLVAVITFILPLLVLNQKIYGSPLVYGYSALNRVLDNSSQTVSSTIDTIMRFLIRTSSPDMKYLFINMLTGLFLISPGFFLSSYVGLFRSKTIKRVGLYISLPIWIILYSGMSNTYNSGIVTLSLHRSVYRYWFLVFLFLAIFVAYSLRDLVVGWKRILVVMFIIMGGILSPVFINGIYTYRQNQLVSVERLHNQVLPFVDKDAYVISPIYDKYFFKDVKPITWWGGAGRFNTYFHPEKLAQLSVNLINEGEKVYAYKSEDFNQQHMDEIESYGVIFVPITQNLYRVYLSDDRIFQ